MVGEIIGQIKKIAITASNRKDQMFLGINVDRNGCITKENLKFLVEKLHLPSSDDVIDAVSIKRNSMKTCAIHPKRLFSKFTKA